MTPFSAWSATGAVPSGRGWSEQALLTLLWGDHASPLQTRWSVLFPDLCRVGAQQVTTTNSIGALTVSTSLNWHQDDASGGRLNASDVEVHLDLRRVGAVFATGAPRRGALQRATRLFDPHGDALLTVTAPPVGPEDRFAAFARRNARPVAPPLPNELCAASAPSTESPSKPQLSAAIDAWKRLSNDGSFESLLDTHRLSRAQIYTAADDPHASRVAPRDIVALLRWMVDRNAPMSLQVGRAGVVAAVRTIPDEVVITRDGLQIIGAGAAVWLDPRRLASAWLVKTGGPSGTRHRSLEILDGAGDLAVCFRGGQQTVAASASGWTRPPFRPSGCP